MVAKACEYLQYVCMQICFGFGVVDIVSCSLNHTCLYAQVPNFALAAPVLVISGAGVWSYLSSNWGRVPYLGLVAASNSPCGLSSSFCKPSGSRPPLQLAPGSGPETPKVNLCFYRDSCFVYVVHWMVLASIALLVMHVQVCAFPVCHDICRMLAVCPWHVCWRVQSVDTLV